MFLYVVGSFRRTDNCARRPLARPPVYLSPGIVNGFIVHHCAICLETGGKAVVSVDILPALCWGGNGRILCRTFGLCRWTGASSGDDGVLVDSGRSRSVRNRGNGCADLTHRAGDRDGAEACAGLSSRGRRGIRELCTWDASDNGAILEVNRLLSFVSGLAHTAYVKEVGTERAKDGGLKVR